MFDILKRAIVFETPWFSLQARTLNQFIDQPYYALRVPDYVSVIAITPNKEIVLVRQYRPAVEAYTLELPSGTVDSGELPLTAVARELLEETGYRSRCFELLGELLSDTGRLDNRLWAYFAFVDSNPNQPLIQPGDLELQTLTMPIHDFLTTCGRPDGCIHALNLAVVSLALLQGRFDEFR